jgi:small conductance mechanosensitive channel
MNIEKYMQEALHWLITVGPKILLGVLILIIGFWLIRILSKFLQNMLVKNDYDPSLKIFIISFVVIALRILLILAVLQIIGIEMSLFAAMIGALGIAAGLALSGTLQNFASGILILLLKPFKVGDSIVTQGQEGIITVIQMFYTTMVTFDNKTVMVPNGKLSNEMITNIGCDGKRRLDVELKVSFGVRFGNNQKNN